MGDEGAMERKDRNQMKSDTIAKTIVAILFVGGICIVVPKGCTQPDKAKRVLEQQGFKDISITGWRPAMAGKEDTFSTGFEATASNGQRVSGAVTGGWLKGSTVRFD